MKSLLFERPENRPFRILTLGAHCDDIAIGCGGALLHLVETNPDAEVWWVVFASTDVRLQEEADAAERFLERVGKKQIIIKQWQDGHLPYYASEIKNYFEGMKHLFSPDIIFTHFRHDGHQDHRIISELTLNTYRNHLVLEYEIPKYDGDFGSPNLYMPLTDLECRTKVETVMNCYASQREKHWFAADVFLGLARIRGMEAGGTTNYAEGFYSRKLCLR